uniref:Uncharacterized protein n=1 Tax=Ditylum brightwellii TaxID=49249 RepID=A0A7S4T100_9STRA|mmetsp:Transcript_16582/g.23440  ORF Transcript_16582/g.23440 Transcript_16582/m.23440 type:complete len:150 (+) Transcript_16582:146-595(+)
MWIFSTILKSARGAVGALLVYDLSMRPSFTNLERWLNELREFAGPDIVIMLVGNKSDLEDKRIVQKREGMEFSKKNKLAFIETSALKNDNVDVAFNQLLVEIHRLTTKKALEAEAEGEEASKAASSSAQSKNTISLSTGERKSGCCVGG